MSSHETAETESSDRNETDHYGSGDEGHSATLLISGLDAQVVVNEQFQANEGNVDLHAGVADDHLEGGNGDDHLFGNVGNDLLVAGSGNDRIEGDAGNDQIEGDEGNDELHGGIGDDRLEGGNGDDQLFGDDGNDVLRAGFGNDALTGGAGQDVFTFCAIGEFKVMDYSVLDDHLVFDKATTGIHDLDELLSFVTKIEDTPQGVVIEFGQVASITLVGLTSAELTPSMVQFL